MNYSSKTDLTQFLYLDIFIQLELLIIISNDYLRCYYHANINIFE